ncbi:hypothetical protein EOPP23_12065 [Endozoicomonas sp. OPT23]|uniref:PilW family protein n=1 Tax=Endozoicomonas sp. OPT23 TaxID=2072845 RepID=UPI00129A54A8|nr:PilW family protein [Endozoicomonas sp. OPT23]MRI33722.1 hypothetical protein [Endozoicomonas sp. OPT23]
MKKISLKSQKGLALVELMIALVLSAVLMLGVTKMFADSVASSSTETALAEVQDSARSAMEIIKRDIRMAGYRGDFPGFVDPIEGSLINLNQVAVRNTANSGTQPDSLNVLRAFETNKPLDLAEDLDGDDITSGSGVVRVVSFYDSANAGSKQITLDRKICYNDGSVFLVSDGEKHVIFKPKDKMKCTDNAADSTDRMTPVGESDVEISLKDFGIPENCNFPTDQSSLPNCPILHEISSVNGSVYSIRAVNPALLRNGVEMVRGVENLQVLLGISDADGKTLYRESCTDNQIDNDQCNVTHVKISLVVASPFSVFSQATAQRFPIYNLSAGDAILQTNDRFLRRVFTSTIQLRNGVELVN